MALGVVFLTPQDEPALGVLLHGRSALIGRAPGALLRLPEPTVSARHATLKKRGGVYLISDEGSQNGTLVQARDSEWPVKLSADSPRVVLSGDRVLLGNVALELFPDAPEDVDREVEWLDDPSEVPEALVRRALERVGESPSAVALEVAVRELFHSPDEPLGGAQPRHGQVSPSPSPAANEAEPLPPSPVPLDLALSLMALFLTLVAGAALYRLVVSGAVLSP